MFMSARCRKKYLEKVGVSRYSLCRLMEKRESWIEGSV